MKDDRISVKLELDTSYFDKNMDEAVDKLDKFGKKLDNPFNLDIDLGQELFSGVTDEVDRVFNNLEERMTRYQQEIAQAQERLTKINPLYERAVAAGPLASNERDYFGGLKAEQQAIIEVDTKELEKAKEDMETLQNALTTLSQHKMGKPIDLGDSLPESQELINKFDGMRKKGKLIGTVLKGAFSVGIKEAKLLGGILSKVFEKPLKLFSRIGQNMFRQITTSIASALNPLNNFRKVFDYLTNDLTPRLGATFRNIGNNLTEYFANSRIFQGLINEVLYFIKLLEIAFNKVGALFGWGKLDLFKTSTKSAKEIEKATGGTAKKAKEAAKALAGFDEINNIGNQSGGGAGGGSGGLDATPLPQEDLFKGKDLDMSIFDYINDKIYKLRDTLQSIDFYKVGKTIADGINKFVGGIDWGALTQTVSLGVQGILRTIEGIFDGLDVELISTKIEDIFDNLDLAGVGESLSDAMLAGFNFVDDLISTIDWKKLGEQIGAGLASINWVAILIKGFIIINVKLPIMLWEILWGAITGGFETLKEKLPEKIEEIREQLPDWLNKVIDKVSEFWGNLKKWFSEKWSDFKLGLASKLINLKTDVSNKFNDIKTAIGTKITGAIDFIKTKFTWSNIKSTFTNIATSIGNKFNDIKNTIGNKINGAVQAIKDKLSWNNIKTTFENLIKKIKEKFGQIGTTVGKVLSSKFNEIVKSIITKAVDIINGFIKALNKVVKILNKIPKVDLDYIKEIEYPKLATGTNYVPQDTLAMIHQGEAVIPKKFNDKEYFGGANDETNALLQELIEKVEDIEVNPYTTIKDVGKASINYINEQKRMLGRSVV